MIVNPRFDRVWTADARDVIVCRDVETTEFVVFQRDDETGSFVERDRRFERTWAIDLAEELTVRE